MKKQNHLIWSACIDNMICMSLLFSHHLESERLKTLEEEQEQLNSSLFALTTHFAQVQFRLKQIVDAPTEHKEVSFSGILQQNYHLYINLWLQ